MHNEAASTGRSAVVHGPESSSPPQSPPASAGTSSSTSSASPISAFSSMRRGSPRPSISVPMTGSASPGPPSPVVGRLADTALRAMRTTDLASRTERRRRAHRAQASEAVTHVFENHVHRAFLEVMANLLADYRRFLRPRRIDGPANDVSNVFDHDGFLRASSEQHRVRDGPWAAAVRPWHTPRRDRLTRSPVASCGPLEGPICPHSRSCAGLS